MFKEKDFKSIKQHGETLKTLGILAARSPDSIVIAKLARRPPPFDQDRPELLIPSPVLLNERIENSVIDTSQGPDSPAS